MRVGEWAEQWLTTRTDLRETSRARLVSIVRLHVVREFGDRRLSTIGNAEVRAWVRRMSANGMSAASVRKAVRFAVDARRGGSGSSSLGEPRRSRCRCPPSSRPSNASCPVSRLPTLADAIAPEYRALVLLGAFGGLRWGELAGLRRSPCRRAPVPGHRCGDRDPGRRNDLVRRAEDVKIAPRRPDRTIDHA
ncbi:MAG: hypothetical protein WKF83_11855 [Nocardioidaceae bacterium]